VLVAQLTCCLWLCSYMSIVSYGFFCLTGTIGFYACYIFVRQIYSAVKVCHAAQQPCPKHLALDLLWLTGHPVVTVRFVYSQID